VPCRPDLLLAQIAEQNGKADEANAYLQRIESPQGRSAR